METIEHKIGDTFCLEDGTKLKVVEESSCEGCYFYNKKCTSPEKKCSSITRKDEKSVIFKQIKNNNMKEKRNIQISLEEAREWYNSGDSFKKELALKAYNISELKPIDVYSIKERLDKATYTKIVEKSIVYRKLLTVKEYLYKKYEHTVVNNNYVYYLIIPKLPIIFSAKYTNYKNFGIKVTSIKPHDNVYFNSLEAAKQAIDILGDELKILFE